MEETLKKSKKNKGMAEDSAKSLIGQYKKLESSRTLLDDQWSDISDYFAPRKSNINNSSSNFGATENEAKLFDTTGPDAILIASAGLMAWTTPKSEPWFSFDPPKKLKKFTSVRKWLSECTQIAQEELANSNFYTERHENLIDKLLFGTSALFSKVTDEGKLYFENIPVGTYVIEENYMGVVDTLMRKIQMTARQVVQQFGEENVSKELKECYDKNDSQIHSIIHIVKPRSKKEIKEGKIKRADQKPFMSVYIEEKSFNVLQESGFETFPFAVGRYLSYTGNTEKTAWGYGIGFAALPEARQLNYLQKELLAAIEKSIFPPMMVPDGYEGQIDTSANAIIYYDTKIEDGPGSIKPLDVTGDFNIAIAIKNELKDSLRNKFHVDMFQSFASIEGKQRITAEEVRARINERLDAISPAFDKDIAEVISPLLKRLFIEWISMGILPPPPIEAVQGDYGDGTIELPLPEVTMGSRLALAIKNLRNVNTDLTMQRIGMIAQFNPTVLDIIDFDALVRGTAFDGNFVAEYMKNDEDVNKLREGRAQAQAAQAQQQALLEAAKVIPDSAKEKAIDSAGGLENMM